MSFPTSIEAAEYFQVAYDNLSTTLTQQFNSSDTTAYVSSTANFPSSGWFVCDDDICSYTGKTAYSFTGVIHGVGGTTPADHTASKVVSLTINATAWNRVIAELRAAQTKIGANSSADTSSIDYLVKNTNPNNVTFSHANGIKVDTINENTSNAGVTFKKLVNTVVTATDGGTITFDLAKGGLQRVTLGGNRTLALSNVSVGQCFVIDLIQDATGSRLVTWFTTIKWQDGGTAPTLSTGAGKIDSFGFICVSSGNYQGYIIGQNL